MKPSASLAPVVEKLALEAAVLWLRRGRLVDQAHVGLHELARIDGQIAAQLEGLRVAGPLAQQVCHQQAQSGFADDLFPLAVLVAESDASDLGDQLFEQAATSPLHRQAVIDGLAWAEGPHVREWIERSFAGPTPQHQFIALAAAMARGEATCERLAPLLASCDPQLRALAAESLGRLGATPEDDGLVGLLADSDPDVRDAAAVSGTLLGHGGATVAALRSCVVRQGPLARLAMTLLGRQAPPDEQAAWIAAQLTDDPRRWRLAVWGWMAAGRRDGVDQLVSWTAEVRRARWAAYGVALVTGLGFEDPARCQKPPAERLAGPSEDPGDTHIALDPDEGLPWPRVDWLQPWWEAHRDAFDPEVAWLLGRHRSTDWLGEVLGFGRQHARWLAAVDRALSQPGAGVFDIAAPVARQTARLAALHAPVVPEHAPGLRTATSA